MGSAAGHNAMTFFFSAPSPTAFCASCSASGKLQKKAVEGSARYAADGQNADHLAAVFINLAQCTAERARGVGAGRPERAPRINGVADARAGCIAQRVMRAGAIQRQIERAISSPVACDQARR